MNEKARARSRRSQRRYQAKKRTDPDWRKRDAARQAARRKGMDPNGLREYQRERRFRFTKESVYEHSLKEAGLSIVSETEIKGGAYVFVLRGQRKYESMYDPLPGIC